MPSPAVSSVRCRACSTAAIEVCGTVLDGTKKILLFGIKVEVVVVLLFTRWRSGAPVDVVGVVKRFFSHNDSMS
jgi:hypothetical protein